jgi:hypothetical protein
MVLEYKRNGIIYIFQLIEYANGTPLTHTNQWLCRRDLLPYTNTQPNKLKCTVYC